MCHNIICSTWFIMTVIITNGSTIYYYTCSDSIRIFPTYVPIYIHTYYRYGWLYYINPNFYGFTAVSRVLLENYEVQCPYESDIECYPSSALYILSYFSLDSINPYLNVVVSYILVSDYHISSKNSALLTLYWND